MQVGILGARGHVTAIQGGPIDGCRSWLHYHEWRSLSSCCKEFKLCGPRGLEPDEIFLSPSICSKMEWSGVGVTQLYSD